MSSTNTHAEPSLVEIIKNLRDDTLTLIHQEISLAKRETSEKIATLGKNAALLGMAAVIALYAVFFILFSFANLIELGLIAAGASVPMAAWCGPLILGALLGITALVLAFKAVKAMKNVKPAPENTLATLREDRDWIKGKVK